MNTPRGMPRAMAPATDDLREPRRHWHRRVRHSLRARLVLLFVLLALGTTLVFVLGSREAFATGWRELVRPLANDYIDRLAAEIGDPPDLARAQALARRLPVSISIQGPRLHWQSHPQHVDVVHDSAWRAMLTRRSADGHDIRFGLESWRAPEDRPRWIGWATLAGLLTLTALAYLTVRRLFRPLDDIRDGARRYEAGDFSRTIPLRRRDELGDLAAQVNAMATGLQHMLEGQRGLLLAISHELRSPLTRARLHAELLPEGAEREALLRDLGQMRELIASLLESERLAGGAASLQRVPADLNELVRTVLAEHFDGQNVQLDLDPALPRVALDVARMQMLVRNLVDNALRHGDGVAQPPQVTTRRLQAGVELSVRDHGSGLDAEQRAHLGEPFHRPDAARTRERGGVGLGLYLCRRVAQAHGASLDFDDAAPGLLVRVGLPA